MHGDASASDSERDQKQKMQNAKHPFWIFVEASVNSRRTRYSLVQPDRHGPNEVLRRQPKQNLLMVIFSIRLCVLNTARIILFSIEWSERQIFIYSADQSPTLFQSNALIEKINGFSNEIHFSISRFRFHFLLK